MNTEILFELIQKKHKVLSQIHELSVRQQAFVDTEAMDKLLKVLATKQSLILELQDLEKKLEPFRAEDPDRRRWSSPAVRGKARQLAEESERLVQEILRMEQHSERDLVMRRDATAERLQGLHVATQAQAAYSHAVPAAHTSLDLSSES